MNQHHDIAIIGSGFCGVGMGIELKRNGFNDFVVLEKASELGGTWRDNTYPGCACDVPSPFYSFSFAPNPNWGRMYSPYNEIYAYTQECVDRFAIRDHIQLDTEVTGAEWDESRQLWHIEVAGKRAMTARVLMPGLGGLSMASYPNIDGLQSFEGPVVHTAKWDSELDLQGKRVAVIGTGASAIQLIPELAKMGGHVDVFMRTPPWVLPKADRKFMTIEKQMFKRFPVTQRALRGIVFGLTEFFGYALTRENRFLAPMERAGRRHIAKFIKDPELRRKLTPTYRIGCKRVLFANSFYPAMARDNVDLVTEGIERITETGIVTADGKEHEVDAIVLGTGFSMAEVFTSLSLRGRDGVELAAEWSERIQAHRGTTIAGFPNLMMLSGPNTGTGSTSQIYMFESQFRYILSALKLMRANGRAVFEVRETAQAAYNSWLQRQMKKSVWIRGGCNSWYLDASGHNFTLYPGVSSSYRRSMREFRTDEYVLQPARAPQPVTSNGNGTAPRASAAN